MEYKIKNGLFKHQLEGREKLVAVKLFINGWAITDSIGNTMATIKKEKDGVVSEDWSATFLQEETTALRVTGVKEVLIHHKDGKEYRFQRGKDCFQMSLDGKEYRAEGITSRNCTLHLPDEMAALDAMVLFCILRIAEEKVAVV